MASNEAIEFADFLATLRTRSSDPRLDLPTIRDIIESVHLATKEPEGVSYAEVNVAGVEALWCKPADSDESAVLLHNHMGGTVVASMHSDRKAAGHIAKAAGVTALVLNYRRSPEQKFPAQIDDVDNAYNWLLEQGYRPQNIASVGHSIGGNFAISLALRLRDSGAPLPCAILSISPWVDITISNPTIDGNADADTQAHAFHLTARVHEANGDHAAAAQNHRAAAEHPGARPEHRERHEQHRNEHPDHHVAA